MYVTTVRGRRYENILIINMQKKDRNKYKKTITKN